MAGSMEYMEVKGYILWSRKDVYKWKNLRPTEKQQKKKYVNTVLRIKIIWSWANIGLIDLITGRALLLDSGRHQCQVQTHHSHPVLPLLLFLHFLRKNPKITPCTNQMVKALICTENLKSAPVSFLGAQKMSTDTAHRLFSLDLGTSS